MSFSFKQISQKPFFNNEKVLIRIYLIACVLISLKIAFLESYDNYDSFVAAFEHLKKQYDLYLMYPSEYHTEYNYSPSFALFMGLFYYFPDWIGILLWNLTHTVALLTAIHLMPIELKKKIFIYWFCLVEYITAAENVQTNATVTALIMLVFIYQEKGKTSWASLFFVFGFFFKIYVLTAGVFFLCYKKRGAFILKGLGWALLFFAMPLMIVSFDQLIFLYQSWFHRLQLQSIRDSLSLIGVIGMFKSIQIDQGWIILAGTISMLLVLLKKEVYQNSQFRQLYLGGILLFTVVFNPGVESPSYIIAVAGAAIWYITLDRLKWHQWLMIVLFIFTCLSPTEIFPKPIRDNFLKPYHIKAIPCIIVWSVCMFELFTWKKTNTISKSIA
jgi:hypothetical protein